MGASDVDEPDTPHPRPSDNDADYPLVVLSIDTSVGRPRILAKAGGYPIGLVDFDNVNDVVAEYIRRQRKPS